MCLILVLGLVGCGGGDSGGSGDAVRRTSTDSSPGSANGSDGQSTAEAPTEDLGETSVPLAPSADGVTSMESGTATIVQFNVPLDEWQATIAFYDDWTEGQAGDYVRTESESGGVGWQNVPTPGTDKQIIAVLSPLEGDEFVTVTLTMAPAE